MKHSTDDQPGNWPGRILAACRRLEVLDSDSSIDAAFGGLGASPSELRRQFRARLGISPGHYLQALRLQRMVQGLHRSPTVLAAALDAGFGSSTRAYAIAGEMTGLPPAALRDAPRIGWWLGLSELGWMLMAATPTGICWLAFGSSAGDLLASLESAFPGASWINDSPRLSRWFDQVRDHLLLPEAALELPVDIRGTAFQARVWQALRTIPLGETRSYGDLARMLDKPRAARAVASACGANRIAVLIPCHRIIAADGSLSGYRWGTERKQQLLDAERRAARKDRGTADPALR